MNAQSSQEDVDVEKFVAEDELSGTLPAYTADDSNAEYRYVQIHEDILLN
jgi:hypothetical protein